MVELKSDPEIASQKFVCLSLLCPEEVIKKREAFYFEKFMADTCARFNQVLDSIAGRTGRADESDGTEGGNKFMVDGIRDAHPELSDSTKLWDAYRSFVSLNFEALSDEWETLHGPGTSVRGIKVRGSFRTLDEAKARAEKLRDIEPEHSVYVATVGSWVPFDPFADANAQSQEFAEAGLQGLMKEYTMSQEEKELAFEARKAKLADRTSKLGAAVAKANQRKAVNK